MRHDKFFTSSFSADPSADPSTDGEPVRRARGHGRGRGGHAGWGGPDAWGSGPWEWAGMGPMGGPRGRRGGPRARRGDVRHAIIDVLAAAGDDDLNGYQVIQAIADKSDGAWKPSPGSVYPTVAQLEDEGLVVTARDGGRKVLRLTPEGTTYAADHAEDLAAVWAAFGDEAESGDHSDWRERKMAIKQLMGAVGQVLSTGTPDQQEQAMAILNEARRKLFLVLAEEPGQE